jgi:hypothetical protein
MLLFSIFIFDCGFGYLKCCFSLGASIFWFYNFDIDWLWNLGNMPPKQILSNVGSDTWRRSIASRILFHLTFSTGLSSRWFLTKLIIFIVSIWNFHLNRQCSPCPFKKISLFFISNTGPGLRLSRSSIFACFLRHQHSNHETHHQTFFNFNKVTADFYFRSRKSTWLFKKSWRSWL